MLTKILPRSGTRPLSLRVNFAWAFAGNAISAFCRWVLLVMLAKMADPGVVGLFAIAQAVTLPISHFLGLQVAIVQVTDVNDEYEFRHYFAVKFLSAVLALCVSIGVGFWKYAAHPALPVICMLSAGYGVFEVEKVFLAAMQKHERMDCVARSHVLQGLLTLAFFGGAFLISRRLWIAVSGLFLARLVVLWFNDRACAKALIQEALHHPVRFTQFLPDRRVLHLMGTAFPLGLVAGFQTLYTSIPRLLLDTTHGQDLVGYFAAMASLLVAGTMAVAALTHSVMPRLAKYFAGNLRAYFILLGKIILVAVGLGVLAVIVASLLGRWILTLMFTPEYGAYHVELVWVTVAGGALFVFSFFNAGLNAARRFRSQVIAAAAAAGICYLAARAWIPGHGIMGAAWSLLACYLGGALICALFILKAAWDKRTIVSSVEQGRTSGNSTT